MIKRLLSALGFYPTHDPAWAPSAVEVKFAGHDQTKAATVHAHEQRQAAQRRAKAKLTIARSRKGAEVFVMPKREAK